MIFVLHHRDKYDVASHRHITETFVHRRDKYDVASHRHITETFVHRRNIISLYKI